MCVTGVAAVNVGAMGVAVDMASPAVNVIVKLRRHESYSTRVAVVNAADGLR